MSDFVSHMSESPECTENYNPLFSKTLSVLRSSLVAQSVKSLSAMRETWVQSLGQKDPGIGKGIQSFPWRKKWQPLDPLEKEMANHCSILAGEYHGQRSLLGYSSWGHKELGTTE